MKWNALSVDVTERKKKKVFGALNVRWSGTIATLAAFGHPHTVKSAIETMDESVSIGLQGSIRIPMRTKFLFEWVLRGLF